MGCPGASVVDALEEGFGGFVLTQLVEHGTSQIQHRGVGRFDPSDLPECSLCNGDPTFAGTQARQLSPRSGMVTVQLDDRFECLVCGATLLTLEGHQTDQKMRLWQVRVLRKRFLTSFCGGVQLAPVECAETVFQHNFQAGFRMVHVVDALFLEVLMRCGTGWCRLARSLPQSHFSVCCHANTAQSWAARGKEIPGINRYGTRRA